MPVPTASMNCLCATTRQAARSLTRVYEEHLRCANLTPAQFGLLSMLAGRPGIAQAELAGAFDLDQTTLSRNLKLMVAKKWVKGSRSKEDRRQTLYAITADGLKVYKTALPHWQSAQNEMRQALGKDWEASLALLRRLSSAASSLPTA